jgi:raffinose/stachyose/melibiose transport system permease protein
LVVIAPMAAYSLMRRQMRTAKFLRLFLLAGLIIPFQVIMIPLLQEFKFLGIQSTYFALWLTHIAGGIPLAVFIYSGFMSTIPKELEEAAAMDGCSPLRIFWKIVYPLLMPCTITIVIFWGLWIWNDFMAAFILVGPKAQLVFVQLWHMINDQYMKRWDYVFAGVTLLSVPVTILYVIMQRHFIKGLTAGAVK